MEVIYKAYDKDISFESFVQFLEKNDHLFIDPFSKHVNISEYAKKLIKFGYIEIALIDNKIVGVACSYLNDVLDRIGHLQLLLVNDKYHGFGIGKHLCKSIISKAKEFNMKQVVLTVDEDNIKAKKLYESLGFRFYDNVNEKRPKKDRMVLYINENRNILTIKEIQLKLFYMGKSICDILEKHEIPYIITFGTLLGAVRHKGFIPWDDDFDLFLFDDTYDKALEVLRKELPNDMFVEYYDSEPKFFHAWARVKDKTTECDYDMFPQDKIYNFKGLIVDLYKLIKMEEKDIDLFRLRENKLYQERKYKLGLISKENFDLKNNELDNLIKIEQMKSDNIESNVAYGMTLNERVAYIEEIFPLKRYKFEDYEFWGPNNFDSMLTRFYGDYMKLPEVLKRKPHYLKVTNRSKLC